MNDDILDWVLDRGLPCTQKMVLIVLADMADETDMTTDRLTIGEISSRAGLGVYPVLRALDDLVFSGLISVTDDCRNNAPLDTRVKPQATLETPPDPFEKPEDLAISFSINLDRSELLVSRTQVLTPDEIDFILRGDSTREIAPGRRDDARAGGIGSVPAGKLHQ